MGMKCKECKYWEEGYGYEGILKTCNQPKAKKGYRWNADDMPDDGLWLENDEGWAWFTGPEFGCINFESKE